MVRKTMTHFPEQKRYSEAEAIGIALKRLRKRADLTQDQAAEAAGVATQSWRRYEWGERSLALDKLDGLARSLGTTLAELLAEKDRVLGGLGPRPSHERPADIIPLPRPEPAVQEFQRVPIGDTVRAGSWEEVDDIGQERTGLSTTLRDARYAHAEQWIAPVRGDSVNRLGIDDGDYVHCVDAIAIGYEPVTGHLVEVERLRFQGRLRELTLKQVEITENGVILWPRSTNPRWNEPIRIMDGVEDEEGTEVRIKGLVIAAIKRF